MTKIAILGANGQLGYDLVKVLSANSQNQVIEITREKIDALSNEVVNQLSVLQDMDYVINCVAVTNVDGCEDNSNDAFTINASFAYQLAKFCGANDITLFHISTDYVFDGTKNTPYVESDLANPLNIYGLSKYAGELAVAKYVHKHFIMRVSSLFGVAGAAGKGGNFVTTMIRLAKEKDSWTVINDQITCPTHTLDIARAISTMIEKQADDYGVYNCVSSSSCSWFEFTQEILRNIGESVDKVNPVSYKDYAFKALRPQYGVMSIAKLSKYYQMPDYKSALNEYLKLKGFIN